MKIDALGIWRLVTVKGNPTVLMNLPRAQKLVSRARLDALENMVKEGVTQVALTSIENKMDRLMDFVANELRPSFG